MPQENQINALNELWSRYQVNPTIFTEDQVGAMNELRGRWGLTEPPDPATVPAQPPFLQPGNQATQEAVMQEFNVMADMHDVVARPEETLAPQSMTQQLLDAPAAAARELEAREAHEKKEEIPEEIKPLDSAVRAYRSFNEGNLDLPDIVGGPAVWAEMEATGRSLRSIFGVFSWESLSDPTFYPTAGSTILPLLESFGLPAISVDLEEPTVSAAVASVLAPRPRENAIEAIVFYNALIEQGVADNVASEQAAAMFTKNMALTGMDAVQFTLAFAKVPESIRPGMADWVRREGVRSPGFASGSLSKGYEEVIGGYFKEVGQRAVAGEVDAPLLESIKLASPEAKEAFVIGTFGDLGTQASMAMAEGMSTRDANNIIQEYIDKLTPEEVPSEEEEPSAAPKPEAAPDVEVEPTAEAGPEGAAGAAEVAPEPTPAELAPAVSTGVEIELPFDLPPTEPRPIPSITTPVERPQLQYVEKPRIVGYIKGEPQFRGTTKVPTGESILAVTNDWMRRYITGEMVSFEEMEKTFPGVAKGVLLNIFRSAKRVPGPFVLEMAEAFANDPINATKEVVLYPLEWAIRLEILANPFTLPADRAKAAQEWTEDPLGPVFAFWLVRAGAKGVVGAVRKRQPVGEVVGKGDVKPKPGPTPREAAKAALETTTEPFSLEIQETAKIRVSPEQAALDLGVQRVSPKTGIRAPEGAPPPERGLPLFESLEAAKLSEAQKRQVGIPEVALESYPEQSPVPRPKAAPEQRPTSAAGEPTSPPGEGPRGKAAKPKPKTTTKERSIAQQKAARVQSRKLRDSTVIDPKDLSQMPAVQAIFGVNAARDYPRLFEDVKIARKGRSPIGAEDLLRRDKSVKQDYDVLDTSSLPSEYYQRYGQYKDFDKLVDLARDEINHYAETGKPFDPYSIESADMRLPEPIDTPESMSMLFSTVGVPNPQILLESVKQISKATSEMIEKSKMPEKVRVGVEQGLDLMVEHDRMIRRAEATSNWLESTVDKVVPDAARQMLMVQAYEAKMSGKYWDQLSGLEKSITQWLAGEKQKLNDFVDQNKVLERMEETDINHIFHHWKNPRTGRPYQAMYGKFSKGLPQSKQRTISTYEAGIEQGLTPATTNMGALIGLEWQSVMRSHQSRQMFAGLHNVEAGIEGSILPRKKAEPRPLQMVERWDLLRDQGLTEGYERYHHSQLDKPIVYKGTDGATRIIKGPVGVRRELYHHVRAYLENPQYTSFDHLNNAAKSLKLASLFHATSLGFQEAANFRVPFKNIPRGLRQSKDWSDPRLRLLYEEGLEVKKGYEDVGYRNSFFTGETVAGKFGNTVTKPIEYMRDFIFDVVQPGMKVSFALDTYNKILPRYIKAGIEKGATEKQSTQLAARRAVQAADGHFSGEHWKRSLLETNRFMVKLYFEPGARLWWQRLLLSPTWQREHLLVAKRVAQSFMPESMTKKFGLEDLGPIRKEYRKYALGAITIMGTADLWNQMSTLQMDGESKHLWENPEDKGFAVRAWWDEPDYTVTDDNGKTRTIRGGPAYFRPLKSVFEVAEFADDPIKKFGYKLSPALAALGHQFFPSRYQPEYKGWKDMPARTRDFILDVATPMAAERGALVFQGKRRLPAGLMPFFGFPTSMVKNKSKRATLNQINTLIFEGDMEGATSMMREWNSKHPGDFITP